MLCPYSYTDHESPESPRIDTCFDSAGFVDKYKCFNPFCDVLRFSYKTCKKQLRIFTGFGLSRRDTVPNSLPCAITYICRNAARIDHKLVENTPNAARIWHELTEIRDESQRFARFSLTIAVYKGSSMLRGHDCSS